MSYLKDYMSGRNILSFDGDYIKEYSTGRIKYRMSSDRVVDYMSGRILYKIDGFLSGREKMALIAILFG